MKLAMRLGAAGNTEMVIDIDSYLEGDIPPVPPEWEVQIELPFCRKPPP